MKLSFKAFREWVDFPGTAQDLANCLADLGFPNDGITQRGEGVDQVYVGKVLTKAKHPQADRLCLLTVDIGREKLPIVCGANNMEVGDYIALAPVGAKIPGKDGSGMVMREAKIRGETSKGMCCSEAELRLSEESEGIIILPKAQVSDAVLGRKLSEVIDLQDWILEVDVTPNRGDALCIRGLAREVAAKMGLKVKPLSSAKWKNPVAGVKPSIEDFSDASGFAACLVQGVKWGKTPDHWQRFLSAFGARSLSNLVDVTNIVMFELGHPIHFFDADKVDPLTIGVRRARVNEKLELLNGKVISLHPEDLVIADQNGPLSLAGVMGGAGSSVSETTKNILIEVACFNPKRIRATARRHELASESSARFERGLTTHDLDEVVERSLGLLKELSAFETAGGSKVTEKLAATGQVLWDRPRVESKLGRLNKTDDEIFELLRRLEYSFEPKGSAVCVIFPWYRTDASCLEDVMEDIGRLLGYEALERKPLVAFQSKRVWKDLSSTVQMSDRILDRFLSAGYSEVIQLSFTNPDLERKLGYGGDDFVRIENPLHSEKSALRRALLPELLNRAKWNAERGEDEIRLVEVAPVFSTSGETLFEESPRSEKWSVACVWMPKPLDRKYLWSRTSDPYFEFKGVVESIWSDVKGRPQSSLRSPMLYPRRNISFQSGVAGELHPLSLRALDLSGRCFVGEWILSGQIRPRVFGLPTVFPAIDLDASFSALPELKVGDVMDCFQKTKVPFLERVRPYDLFEMEDSNPKKKSMTFAMRYRDGERTLTLEEAKKSHEQLVSTVLGAFSRFEIALR